jgi:hypothetical protein
MHPVMIPAETLRFLARRSVSVLAAVIALLVGAARAEAGATAITCTNPASGTTWQIQIDYGKSTVDSYPARITDATIAWHDAKDGGNYTLDRKSGSLTVIVASSTGGYFLHHRCRLKD